jgi:hypothetical protein
MGGDRWPIQKEANYRDVAMAGAPFAENGKMI